MARPRAILTAKQWASLSRTQRMAYARALEALRLMREGAPLPDAARRAGTRPETVVRYAGAALTRDARGQLLAKPTDRIFRRLPVSTSDGIKELDTTDSRIASEIGRHWSAIGQFAGGNEGPLARFRGMRIAGYALETDPDVIEELLRLGQLDFEDIYDMTR